MDPNQQLVDLFGLGGANSLRSMLEASIASPSRAKAQSRLEALCRTAETNLMEQILLLGVNVSAAVPMLSQIAQTMGISFSQLTMASADEAAVFGTIALDQSNRATFSDGVITDAMRNGGVVLLRDLDLMPIQMAQLLDSLLDSKELKPTTLERRMALGRAERKPTHALRERAPTRSDAE